ncbi:MAG: trigger factor [Azospirillum sp.]|nr:trigger factor [Azospirillum sp.]
MQITETSAEGLKREFKVVIPVAEIDAKVQTRLEELCRTVRIPGFRPGKVPFKVVRQRYGSAVVHEVRDQLINDTSRQAVADRGLRPAFEPNIEVTPPADDADLEFRLELEILPDIEPCDFSTIELDRFQAEVTEDEIDRSLARLAASAATETPLAEPRPAQLGDVLSIDFDGSVGGVPRDGMKAEGHRLELGSNSLIPGFEDQLVGALAGEHRQVTVTFPADYGHADLAGCEAVFEVDVRDVMEKLTPPIDDALAERFGLGNVAGLRTLARDTLVKEYGDLSRTILKRRLLDRLAADHGFLVPERMVSQEFDGIWQRLQEAIKNGQADASDAGRSEDELRAEYHGIAVRRVRLGLLLAEIGRRNNIKVSQEELNRGLIAEARRHPGQEREIFELFKKYPPLVERIRAPLLEDKVVDFILELTRLTDRVVPLEELTRSYEAPEPYQSLA